MHLKRLEAFGFKSFADKVVFDFERGVTIFVGPNGCGKSNVVDAVKWVLGEQSAKSLRGGEMLDVIFNGSGNRKPLNVAEVTLTFDNTSGVLPIHSPEVSVTRRLYRSGDSEYLINKALCRLRDVRELFWDTGVGTASYSVIEQGRIASLLEASSKDRRILFEEAAGIHKYKERKKIALRKLERVEQNLERLTDLLGEVERNLKTVTRQAEKAKKAKEISDKLRATKLDLLLHDAFSCEQALREVSASAALASERSTSLSTELEGAQGATATEQERMSSADAQLTKSQQDLNDASNKLHRIEAEIEAERKAIEELTIETERARAAGAAAGERAAIISMERERAEMDGVRAQDALTLAEGQSGEFSQQVSAEQDQRENQIKTLESARRAAMDAIGRRSQLQDTLVRAEAELNSLEYRVRKIHAQVTKAEDQLRFAQRESEEVRGRMKEVQRRREVLETEQAGLRQVQARTEEEIDRLGRTSQDMQRELESRRSRLTALEGLRESGEGLSPGARAVLTGLRQELNISHEVHGLVADCIGVDPRLEQAIEAALAHHIETIVVDSTRAAQVLSNRLAEQELGRATFLPLDRAAEIAAIRGPRMAPSSEIATGLLGVASDLVSCDERYKSIARALLGDVLIFDTGINAAQAFDHGAGAAGWTCVSLQGGLYEASGVVAGGRYKPQRLGLIGRKNEIARLLVQMDELQLKIQALAERTAFLENRAQKVARDDERMNVDIDALAHTFTELKSMLAAIEREESRSAEEKNLAVQEIHELEAERTAHTERVAQMRGEMDESRRIEAEAQQAVQERELELAAREQTLSDLKQKLADIERESATWRERVVALEREAASLSSQQAEKRDECDRETKRAEAIDERVRLAAATLAEKDRNRAELQDLIDIHTMNVQSLNALKDEARAAFDAARGREREIATELESARGELSTVREKEVNLRVRLESKLAQSRSEFQLDALEELTTRGGPPTFFDAKEEGEDIPEDAILVEERIAKAQALVETLEKRMANLGPVNMYALDELAELEKRHSFLKVQHEDLDSARASLRDVIARINRRSRALFQDTFDAVKTQFNDIFRKLFGGGKADLVLEEGEDILEAGIEILARPPGKEPRNISLLSGGEKTMTMIALLFAVFRSRPAPFCILDEVDAPLDEANVDRFNQIVREFMDKSQFVIITHNKKTMSYADILYGITMPEPGVSKRIAIKFSEIEKHLPMEEINRNAEAARLKSLAQAEAATPADESSDTVPPATPADAKDSEVYEEHQQSVGGE